MALHDTVGQMLALSKIKLGALGQLLADKKAKQVVDELRATLDGALQQTRTLCCELSPPVLYEEGLDAALRWLGEGFQRRQACRFHFEVAGDKTKVSESLSILMFQSVRELLANVEKHAGASQVRVSSRCDDGRLRVSVKDDGRGFDCSAPLQPVGHKNSLGLFSIRERMRDIGGTLAFETMPGKGTTVTLSVPLA